ncbi:MULTISPECIES: zinc-binding dehydrogenase [unclassified Actinoplanes]|uniref:zinc-dependent alcohol dehydrogenase n=1 Tax=unclassified Actinoplanes TaxID=2626549 RepID=UPI0018D2DB03|nr:MULTISPECIES: zinc-binding dehydrogenase [unclassified Actinoplanes]
MRRVGPRLSWRATRLRDRLANRIEEAPRMRAAVKTADGTFTVEQVDSPELPGPDWARIRVRVAGVCGTDLRHWKVPDPAVTGRVMGHEVAGEVAEVGPGVSDLNPGDRVVVETVMGDGVCPWCRVRRYNICPHLYDVRTRTVSRAYAEFLVAPRAKLYRLPERISFEEAALVDTLSVCLHAQHLSGLSIGDRVAVLGAGPIGLGQLMLAKATGARVIISDVVASSRRMARELGADAVVDAANEDVVARVMEFTGGRGADVVFECVGGPAMPVTLPQATRAARRGAAVVVVGGFDEGDVEIALPWQDIQKSEIRILPSASFAVHELDPEQGMVVDLLASGMLDAQRLITHRFPLERINEAFETAADKSGTGAVFVAISV